MNKLTDEYLMDKVREGDAYKLGLLFERYHLALYNFFYQMSHDKMQSQDMTQNVFYKVLKYKHTYKQGSTFKSWLYRIARNTRIDTYNKIKNRAETDIDQFGDNHFLANTLSIEESKENTALLFKSVQRLDEDKRELIIMHFFQEMKPKDIAEVYETSPNNIRVKTHRALKELRSIYEEIIKS